MVTQQGKDATDTDFGYDMTHDEKEGKSYS